MPILFLLFQRSFLWTRSWLEKSRIWRFFRRWSLFFWNSTQLSFHFLRSSFYWFDTLVLLKWIRNFKVFLSRSRFRFVSFLWRWRLLGSYLSTLRNIYHFSLYQIFNFLWHTFRRFVQRLFNLMNQNFAKLVESFHDFFLNIRFRFQSGLIGEALDFYSHMYH